MAPRAKAPVSAYEEARDYRVLFARPVVIATVTFPAFREHTVLGAALNALSPDDIASAEPI